MIRDVKELGYDRIVKTRWFLDMFTNVSEAIYNLEREITVNECVIPYKGHYCFINSLCQTSPFASGSKCGCLLAQRAGSFGGLKYILARAHGLESTAWGITWWKG